MVRILAVALLAVLGCKDDFDSGGESEGEGGAAVVLAISPLDAVVSLSPGVPGTQAYTVTATSADGVSADVTGDARLTAAEPNLGTFVGATFTSGDARGGRTIVTATYGGATASTGVTLRFSTTVIAGGAPKNAATLFEGADDPARAPAFVYPESGVLVPPNLLLLNYQWNAGGNDLFELRFANAQTDIVVYTLGASFQADLGTWTYLAETNRGDAVEVSLRGTSAAGGASVGTAAPISVKFSEENVLGGIYYWTTTDQGVIRYDFGAPSSAPEAFYTPVQSGRCVACHVVTRDGARMAFEFNGGDQQAGILDIASRALLADSTYQANFQTYSPDGALLATTFQGTLTLREGLTGGAMGTIPTGGYATHPDWSPDGETIVFTLPAGASADWEVSGGSLVTVPYAGGAWGATSTLVASGGENNYYSSFSPDGEWVIFNRAPGGSNNNPEADVYVVRVADGTVIELARANGPPSVTNSWARWSPFVQRWNEKGKLMWFTVSSKRAYGNALAAGQPQLWMAAFDPALAEGGEDPGLPAFWLPFQNIGTSNHIAQWTEVIVGVD